LGRAAIEYFLEYHSSLYSVHTSVLYSVIVFPPNTMFGAMHCAASESERSPELELPTTLRHGEAVFGLSRLHEDLSGVGPYWPPELKPAVRNEQEHRNE
jgi:hypothetical protein